MDRENAPKLSATRGLGDALVGWCKFCNDHHYHSMPYGHRTAHCKSPESPYYESGYVLVNPMNTTC